MTQTQQIGMNLQELKGKTEPRIWTKPLRELTPETSYGFKVIKFAKLIGLPLDPWQEWLVIHLGELLPNGKPRFTRVLVLVARQNGKTHLLMVLALYWQFIEKHPLILGMNATMEDAKEILLEADDVAQSIPRLAAMRDRVVKGNTAVKLFTKHGSVYRAVAATEKGGRGKRVDRLIVDELRLHRDWKSYSSAVPAMGARNLENPLGAQAVFITNQGDDNAVVLDSLRAAALEGVKTGSGTLGLFEWSAPDGCDFRLPENWVWANPSLNVRLDIQTLQDAADLAYSGPAEEAYFRTEHLCMKVRALDPAINAAKWSDCYDPEFSLVAIRPDTFTLDFNMREAKPRATLMGVKVMPGGTAQVWIEKEWTDAEALSGLEADVEALVRQHKPRVFTWLPFGPAAAKSPALKMLDVPDTEVREISKADAVSACMALADEVRELKLSHPNDPVLNDQITSAARKPFDEGRWIFTRKQGDSDAAFALAVGVYTARTLPPPSETYVVLPE